MVVEFQRGGSATNGTTLSNLSQGLYLLCKSPYYSIWNWGMMADWAPAKQGPLDWALAKQGHLHWAQALYTETQNISALKPELQSSRDILTELQKIRTLRSTQAEPLSVRSLKTGTAISATALGSLCYPSVFQLVLGQYCRDGAVLQYCTSTAVLPQYCSTGAVLLY